LMVYSVAACRQHRRIKRRSTYGRHVPTLASVCKTTRCHNL
jgi:hypothetical protein